MPALLAALVGCAAPYEARFSDYAVMPGYNAHEVAVAATAAIRVEVLGEPFDLPPAAFSGQVAAEMSIAVADRSIRFTTAASEGATPPYRVVWDFSPPKRAVPPNALCQEGHGASGRGGTPIDAYVVFCRGNQALSAVRARLFYTRTPNSIEFISLVDSVTGKLFSPDPPYFRRSGEAALLEPPPPR
jgi:hypothetical protein